MEERATKRATVLSAILWLVTGACIGIAILFTSDLDRLLDESLSSFLIGYGLYMLMVIVVLFLQVIIHEAGHLVFGLASGYRFFSFRISGLVLMKKGGKLVLRREKVPGTGGQCLMGPPDYNGGRYPYLLYFRLVFRGVSSREGRAAPEHAASHADHMRRSLRPAQRNTHADRKCAQ